MNELYFVGLVSGLTAFCATLLATPLVRGAARRLGYVAKPAADRWHARPTALMGGVSVFAGCAVAVVVSTWVMSVDPGMRIADPRVLGVLGAASLMFAAGILDDTLHFRPATKLVLQTVAAGVLITAGVTYELTQWPVVNMLFTLFWFLGLTNALNLLDNMDGVAVGVGGIAAAFLGITFVMAGQVLLAACCFALAGACAGFLPYNFKPASIFMGDSGSLFIGSLLAGMGAVLPATGTGSLVSVLFVPALIVIIPIADTTLVSVTRTLAGRAVTVGGRDHASHRLVALGLSERQVAGVMYGFAFAGGIVALVLQATDASYNVLLGGLFLVMLFTLAAYLSKFHKYPASVTMRSSPLTVLVSSLLYKGRALEVVLDIVLLALAYYGAFLLRWDGSPPREQIIVFESTLVMVIACYVASFAVMGVYRGAWHQASMTDLRRLIMALPLGALANAAGLAFFFRDSEFSRSTIVLNMLVVAVLTAGARWSFRLVDSYRDTNGHTGRRTLIYGAGRAGVLLMQQLQYNRELDMVPVGFLDDDPGKQNTLLNGLPVYRGGESTEAAFELSRATVIVFAGKKIKPDIAENVLRIARASAIDVYRAGLKLQRLKVHDEKVLRQEIRA